MAATKKNTQETTKKEKAEKKPLNLLASSEKTELDKRVKEYFENYPNEEAVLVVPHRLFSVKNRKTALASVNHEDAKIKEIKKQ